MRQFRGLWLSLALLGVPALATAQATGTVQGVVTQATTNAPLSGVQVFIPGTQIGARTDQNGRFILSRVPAGAQVIETSMLGYSSQQRNVTVGAGQTVNVSFRLNQAAMKLDELVVTGTAGATEKAKVPFAIAKVDASQIVVPPVDAATAIQGKVAGAMVMSGSGRPGSPPSVLLRGPTSINASGRSQEPLYIVDGVILSSSVSDIDSEDILSVEVVKGAAASSLYGSRAANGVIQITTKRGRNMESGDVRYTVRSEYGMNSLGGEFPLTSTHQYALTSDGQFLDASSGKPCGFLDCPSGPALAGQTAATGEDADQWNTYMSQRWPGQTYDQVKRFFQGGNYMNSYVAATGRAGATNFHVSYSNTDQAGVMRGFQGYKRNNFRVNVDQALLDRVNVNASAFYSRSTQDQFPEGSGNPIFDLTRMPAGVNLLACEDDQSSDCLDDPQNMILVPDPTNTESTNPLYEVLTRKYTEDRGRFLGSAQLTYTPVDWLDVKGDVSYDRLDRGRQDYFPKGFRTVSPGDINDGSLYEFSSLDEGLNASITGTGHFNVGDNIHNTTTLRYLYEQHDYGEHSASGVGFAVGGIPQLSNITGDINASSYTQRILADGYSAISDFDIADRYELSALIRNDGSSLFGKDQRRQWYYRIGGAWLIAREPWFNFPGVDELKLRYAHGTAGSRPNFAAQYETFSVSNGLITPVTLGNTQLKPEFSAENEAGVDASFLNGRFGLTVTYAKKSTSNQIMPVPLLPYLGYTTQWQNVGTLDSRTWEGSIDAQLVQTRDFTWSARLLGSTTDATVTELNRPPFNYGVSGQALGEIYYLAEGEKYGTFYGQKFAQSCADLPSGVDCGQFAVNDDGWLVWTGGGSLTDNNWGQSSGLVIGGKPVDWGTPFRGYCTDRVSGEKTLHCPLGNSLPDYNMSFSSTLGWKGFSVYGLLDAVKGVDVYNQALQWAVFKRTAGVYDQTGVPQEKQKPLGYYDALYSMSGLAPSTAFVEDGSFVKLREMALRYHFSADQFDGLPLLNAFSGLTISVTGRNLHTWTDYRGYDPETGKANGETGSAVIARVDGYQYPNFRTWIFGAQLNF